MIEVSGKQFKTLNDEIFVNGEKVMLAFANNELVYPEYMYLGRQSAKVENVNYVGKYVNEQGETVTDTGTYSIYAEMMYYSNIPLYIFNDQLSYYYTKIKDGQRGTIRIRITATASGCKIPSDIDCTFINGAQPVKPYKKLYDNKYQLNTLSFTSFVFSTAIGNGSRAQIVYDYDDCWSSSSSTDDYARGRPLLKTGGYYPIDRLDFRFLSTKCMCSEVSDFHGHYYDTTYWEYSEREDLRGIENFYGYSGGNSDYIHHFLTFSGATIEQV